MDRGLYIIGTPIGNLDDFSPRGCEVLGAADVVFAEDTRRVRKLLSRFELKTPAVSCHRFNEASRVEAVLGRIRDDGEAVALVSDSGMPSVSDPGARVVRACREAGLFVTCIPGPTAVSTALALSGFGDRGHVFAGFPPRKPAKRRRELERWKDTELPVVFYESPYRIFSLLKDVAAVCGDHRTVFFARELTKLYEETRLAEAAELRDALADRKLKGECVLILGPENS
ncbi:16S rRNA (cytidine(1402)-2'-O)-methyltransferase [Kiritimatiella glycovorans]|uniref:Ribosomal RNA small subunit methyltransferase I n=1 Tax=Kiritimatiella glycovorans TaxID=1307763 RepID=A0A0G3EJ04_9BACT|nr:16S rRNA (cytidine(1402)-2'-O)-methyltransferase [Kiritimatiella glycovorans]AKJ65407.1 Ribosomal RNA small subunit methyltransferase I [Kiritimatiella glycovorans]